MPRIIPEEIASSTPSTGSDFQTTFVLKPGGVAGNNVYTSWASLMTDVNVVDGPLIIEIDDSISSPALITSGIHNLKDVSVVGSALKRGVYPALQIAEGAEINNLAEMKFINLINNSTSTCFDISNDEQMIFYQCILESINTGVMFSSSSNFSLDLRTTELSGSNTLIDVTAGTTSIFLSENSQISSDLIDSALATSVDYYYVDSTSTVLSQSGILGSSNSIYNEDSEKIYYDNSISGLTASNVKDAIDEISGASGGDINGPGAAVLDKGLVTWNGTGGTTIQDSGIRHYGKSATDPSSPTPGDGDIYYNTVLKMQMEYDGLRSKWLSTETALFEFGKSGAVMPGQYYRSMDNKVFTDTIGFYGLRNGTVVSIAFSRSNTTSITFEVTADGVQIETLGATTSTSGRNISANGDFNFGNILGVRNLLSGSTANDVVGWVRIKWRI